MFLASSLSEHLSSPEYLHVLLNPLPVYGLAVGALGLFLGLLSRTRAARVMALALVFLTTISAWPAYHYGQASYDRVKAIADSDGDKWLDEHMRRAEQLIYVFYVVAALSAAAIIAEFQIAKIRSSVGNRDLDSLYRKSASGATSPTRADTCVIASFASNPRRNRNRKNIIIMTKNTITTGAFALALAAALTGCATTQSPPLLSSNPASPEAREGRTPPPPRLHADDLIQKANERLKGNAPVQPQYQPSEMGNMPGMQHGGMNMDTEQKKEGE